LTEQAPALLRAALEGRREELLDLLRSLVEIESHVTQPDGVRRVGHAVAAELERAGCTCTETDGKVTVNCFGA